MISAQVEGWLSEGWRPSTAQGVEGVGVDVFPRISGTELEEDAAHADAHDSADLERPEADGVDLRLGPPGTLQAQAAQGDGHSAPWSTPFDPFSAMRLKGMGRADAIN